MSCSSIPARCFRRDHGPVYFFVDWRYFGFHGFKVGHLPLWNPHIYCGAPFFGNCQSAMLYPPNVLYRRDAIGNGDQLEHRAERIAWGSIYILLAAPSPVALAGLFPGGSNVYVLRAALFADSRRAFAEFMHLDLGALLFLAIDKIIDRPALGPCLLGMFATAMAVFAGHPQYVFYLGVAAGFTRP